MTEKEMNRIYETIDLLKLLSKRGREEIRHFSHFLIFYGFYVAACILVALIFKTYLWIELLYLTGLVSLLSKKIGLANIFVFLIWSAAFALKVATIFWVTPAAGGVFNALFHKNMTGDNTYGAFWAIIYGVCLFASGIIAPGFYIIGLFSLFIIPLLYSIGTTIGLASYGVLGCSVACYGIYLKIRK